MTKQLAIIRNPKIVWEDRHAHYVISFAAFVSESQSSDQYIGPKDPEFFELWQALAPTGCVQWLDGKPCWLEIDDFNQIATFISLAKL